MGERIRSTVDSANRRLAFFDTPLGKAMMVVLLPIGTAVVAFFMTGARSKFNTEVEQAPVVKQLANAVAKNSELQAATNEIASDNKRAIAEALKKASEYQLLVIQLQNDQRVIQLDVTRYMERLDAIKDQQEKLERRVGSLERRGSGSRESP